MIKYNWELINENGHLYNTIKRKKYSGKIYWI